MSKFQALAFFGLLSLSARAETVLWKATGTITEGTGVFFRNDLPPDAPLTIRVTYDDQAIPQNRVNLVFPGRFEDDYRTGIDLRVIVTAGSYLWEGFVNSAAATGPTTFHTFTYSYPSAEAIKLTIDSSDGGTFPSFPFRLGDGFASLKFDLGGSDNTFLDSGIAPLAINLSALSTGTGIISTGVGNDLDFSIDPTSVEILFEADEVIPPTAPIVSASHTSESISLTWQSDFRYRYRVETTDDLSSQAWTEIETRNGTDTIITRDYERADFPNYFRIVVIERQGP